MFDAIWASQVIHHVADLPEFAVEMRRVLNPWGHLLLRGGFGPPEAVPFYRYFPEAWAEGTAVSLALPEISKTLAAAGLVQVAHRRVGQVLADSAATFLARARSRTLSNLAALPDDLFHKGLQAIERDAANGHLPDRVVEHLDLVVFRRTPPTAS